MLMRDIQTVLKVEEKDLFRFRVYRIIVTSLSFEANHEVKHLLVTWYIGTCVELHGDLSLRLRILQ